MMIERFESPPPEKMFRMPKNWLLERKRLSSRVSMPGMGMAARTRKTTKAKSTKRILLRRDMSVQISFILFQKFCIDFYFPPLKPQALPHFGEFFFLSGTLHN